MKYMDIAGKRVARIAFGSTDFGGKLSEAAARELLDTYRQAGGNYIDTAHVYGDFVTPKNGESEKVIGRWISDNHLRQSVFLSTKGAHHRLGTEPLGRLSREELRRDMSESLEALQTDCVDIYWLHRDNPAFTVGEVMETLQELIEDGCTKLIGASNWTTERIVEANDYASSHGLTRFYANQPRFSLPVQPGPADRSLVQADGMMLKMHRERRMLMTPYSSQAHGLLYKLDTLGAEALRGSSAECMLTPENLAIYARAKQLSRETGLSPAALGLLWLCEQDFPLIPIVGASRPQQLAPLMEAADADISTAQRDFLRGV